MNIELLLMTFVFTVTLYMPGAYNFYHSPLQINIECTFGMLVHSWGELQKPIPVNIYIDKTTHIVCALCILHNFYIDEKE